MLLNLCAKERVEVLTKLSASEGVPSISDLVRLAQKKSQEATSTQSPDPKAPPKLDAKAASKWRKAAAAEVAERAPPVGGAPAGEAGGSAEGEVEAEAKIRKDRGSLFSSPKRAAASRHKPVPLLNERSADIMRQSLFRMGVAQGMGVAPSIRGPDIDCDMLRLILTDAGSPFSNEVCPPHPNPHPALPLPFPRQGQPPSPTPVLQTGCTHPRAWPLSRRARRQSSPRVAPLSTRPPPMRPLTHPLTLPPRLPEPRRWTGC